MGNTALEVLWWFFFLLILHTYFIYPIILISIASFLQTARDVSYLFGRADRRKHNIAPDAAPRVSLLIAAYNEEKIIAERLQNALALDYPSDKLEIIVGSDGCTDMTDEIVKRYESRGIKLSPGTRRTGKSGVLNRLAEAASGDILVFSDANTMYAPDAVSKLVRHFQKPKVGCVSGELIITARNSEVVEEGIYWKYEAMLKFMESKIDSTLGANGGIYAIRKELYRPIPIETITDDFVIGMRVREQGYRAVFDPEARAYEDTAPDLKSEMTRRIRISAGNFQSIALTKSFLNPQMGFISFAYWSHKIIRWFVPFFLIGVFITNALLLESPYYQLLFVAQIAIYLLSLAGYALGKRKNVRILNFFYYFVSMNYALLLGFARFIAKTQKVTWQRTER
ncbi:MAG: glycosyltransferase family 2 protein [Deltaproteobacteria bacterium]